MKSISACGGHSGNQRCSAPGPTVFFLHSLRGGGLGKATTESKSRFLSLTRPRGGKTGFGKTGARMMVVGDSFSSGSIAPVSTTIVSALINAGRAAGTGSGEREIPRDIPESERSLL